MANRIIESKNQPIVAPNSSVQLSSGVATVPPCSKLVMVTTVAGNVTIKTLDGTSVTLTTVPTGILVLDIQFDTVTWAGTATAAGFYTQ
jgi:hypothetical protein